MVNMYDLSLEGFAAWCKKERAAEAEERARKQELKATALAEALRKELERHGLTDSEVAMQKLSEDDIALWTSQSQNSPEIIIKNQGNVVKRKCFILQKKISMPLEDCRDKASPKELLVHEKKCYVLLKSFSMPLETEEAYPQELLAHVRKEETLIKSVKNLSKNLNYVRKETSNDPLSKIVRLENQKDLVTKQRTSSEQFSIDICSKVKFEESKTFDKHYKKRVKLKYNNDFDLILLMIMK